MSDDEYFNEARGEEAAALEEQEDVADEGEEEEESDSTEVLDPNEQDNTYPALSSSDDDDDDDDDERGLYLHEGYNYGYALRRLEEIAQSVMGRQQLSPPRRGRRRRYRDDDDGFGGESDDDEDDDNGGDDNDDDDDGGDDDEASTRSSDGSSIIEGRWEHSRPMRHAMGMGVLRLRPVRRRTKDNDDINSAGDDDDDDGEEDDMPGAEGEEDEEEEGRRPSSSPRWVVAIDSESFEFAVADLQYADDTLGAEIEHMVVSNNLPWSEWSRRDIATYPHFFHRFVELLDAPHRIIRSIKFEGVHLDVHEGARPDDLDQLFGVTLPRHNTLRKIEFEGCFLPLQYFDRFVSSLPPSTGTTPPIALVLEGGVQEVDGGSRFQPVSDLVRSNARVSDLSLSAGFHGLESDEFRLVCRVLERNTNLRTLRVELVRVEAGTLDSALAPSSPIEVLHLKAGKWEDAAASSLATLLKGNATLVELTVAGAIGRVRDKHRLDAIAAVMETSNVTLQRFSEVDDNDDRHHLLVPDSRIGKCLRRNRWIHHVLQAWANYRVPSKKLWPKVLVRADSSPTCVYRFVRRGNLPALCDAVVAAKASQPRFTQTKKRGMSSPRSDDNLRWKKASR